MKTIELGRAGDPKGHNKYRARWKLVLAIVLAVPLAALLGLLGYREAAQYSLRQQPPVTSPDGVESLEEVELGGVEQSVLIRGADRDKPVLLWLHGGPGVPAMPLAHSQDRELVKHFVVVHWDQRGAGRSYDGGLTEGDLTTERYVSDTHELVEKLEDRFGEEKVYLVGHSWGSALGALAVERHPEDFHAFVGVGQLVDNRESDRIAYAHALQEARRRGDEEALASLEEIGPPPWETVEQGSEFARLNAELGGITHRPVPNQFVTAALSPAYSLGDVYGSVKGARFSVAAMLDDLDRIDLFEQAPRLEAPVYIFQGRHDYATPWPLAERYYGALEAPRGKELVWFERSAHALRAEEPEKFDEEMLRVLRETYPSEG